MKCPKEAGSDAEACFKTDMNRKVVCSLPREHKGLHHAHNSNGKCLKVFKGVEMKIESKQYEWVCKACKGNSFILMDIALDLGWKDLEPYYYHYSLTYPKGCHQRIDYKNIFKYAKRKEIKE